MKVLYALNASCRHSTQYFAVSQSKVPHFDLMSSITSGITTSPKTDSYTAVSSLWISIIIIHGIDFKNPLFL
jgi:hypothetical protein